MDSSSFIHRSDSDHWEHPSIGELMLAFWSVMFPDNMG